MTAPIRVLLVDDHAVVREGYRRLLEATAGIRVIAEAGSGEEAYACFVQLDPDVIVMDITLPGISGLEALRRILGRQPSARVLMFSMHEDPVFVARALDGGALGYLTKASAPDLMVRAVQAIAAGQRFVPAELSRMVQGSARGADLRSLDSLTEREFETLRLLAAGHGLTQIATLLCVSGKTVANYQTSIRQKLGCVNAMQLLRIAVECGLTNARPTPGALLAESNG